MLKPRFRYRLSNSARGVIEWFKISHENQFLVSTDLRNQCLAISNRCVEVLLKMCFVNLKTDTTHI